MTEIELREADRIEQALAFADEQREVALAELGGLLIDLRDPASVADGLDQVREAKRKLDELRGLLELLLVAESQRLGSKTLDLEGGLHVEIRGGRSTAYDVETLAFALEEAGVPQERLEQAFTTEVVWKLDRRVLRSIASANDDYAKVIEAHSHPIETRLSATVKRART